MIGAIKTFNIVEYCVIAAFSLMMGIACIGIGCILVGEPIFNYDDWIGIGVMIGVCVVGIVAISKHRINRG